MMNSALTPSTRVPEFEERQPLGNDKERAQIYNSNVSDRDVNGLPHRQWQGVYSHVEINGTDPKSKLRKINPLSSVLEKNFSGRMYIAMVADNPDEKTSTGDEVQDLQSQCRPFIVPATNISDCGQRILFNPKEKYPDGQRYLTGKKNGVPRFTPTVEFLEYPIVKYLIGGKYCVSFSKMSNLKSKMKREDDWTYIPSDEDESMEPGALVGKRARPHAQTGPPIDPKGLSPAKPASLNPPHKKFREAIHGVGDKATKTAKLPDTEAGQKKKKKKKSNSSQGQNNGNTSAKPQNVSKLTSQAGARMNTKQTAQQQTAQQHSTMPSSTNSDQNVVASVPGPRNQTNLGGPSSAQTNVAPSLVTHPSLGSTISTNFSGPPDQPMYSQHDTTANHFDSAESASGEHGFLGRIGDAFSASGRSSVHNGIPPQNVNTNQNLWSGLPPAHTTVAPVLHSQTYAVNAGPNSQTGFSPAYTQYGLNNGHQPPIGTGYSIASLHPGQYGFTKVGTTAATMGYEGTTAGNTEETHPSNEYHELGRREMMETPNVGGRSAAADQPLRDIAMFKLPNSPMFGTKPLPRKKILESLFERGASWETMEIASQVFVHLNAIRNENRASCQCPQAANRPPKRKWRNDENMATLVSKLPFPLPIQTRVQAIHAHEKLKDEKCMETVVRGIVNIVENARKSDPGKTVVALIGNAIIGRFNLAWMMIKKYKSQEAADPLPSSFSAFIPDPRKPEDVCLFKLTLYSVRNLIRLFENALSACTDADITEKVQVQKKKKVNGVDVIVEQKPKKPEDKFNDWIRAMRNEMKTRYDKHNIPGDLANTNKTTKETLSKVEKFGNTAMKMGLEEYLSYPLVANVRAILNETPQLSPTASPESGSNSSPISDQREQVAGTSPITSRRSPQQEETEYFEEEEEVEADGEAAVEGPDDLDDEDEEDEDDRMDTSHLHFENSVVESDDEESEESVEDVEC